MKLGLAQRVLGTVMGDTFPNHNNIETLHSTI